MCWNPMIRYEIFTLSNLKNLENILDNYEKDDSFGGSFGEDEEGARIFSIIVLLPK